MAATANRNSANPLRIEGTRQSAGGGNAIVEGPPLGRSATKGPRRKPSMAERPFQKHTIEEQRFVSESRGAADPPAPLLCKRAFKELIIGAVDRRLCQQRRTIPPAWGRRGCGVNASN